MPKYVTRVKIYKITLGSIMLILGGVFLLWSKNVKKLKALPALKSENLIKNLRFFSETEKNREILIDVEKANIYSETQVTMNNLSATITANPSQKIHILAPYGLFNQKAKKLSLKNGVKIKHDNGLKIYTPSATYEAKSDQLTGNEGIEAFYRNIELKADNFIVDNNSASIKVDGKAQLLIRRE